MTLEKIKDIAKEARIDDNEESLTFKASVILLYGILNNTCSVNKLKKGTGYWWKEVYFIVHNFWAAGIIQAYQYDVDFSDSEIISLTLYAMVGAGELVRTMEEFNPTEKPLSWGEYEERTKYCRGTYTARQRCLMPIEGVREINRRRENNEPIFQLEDEESEKEISNELITETDAPIQKDGPYLFHIPFDCK